MLLRTFLFSLVFFVTTLKAQNNKSIEQIDKNAWISGNSLNQPEQGWASQNSEAIMVEGLARKQAHSMVQAINSNMRTAYDQNIKTVGKNLFPIIYAESTPDGGRYTLLISHGKSISVSPTPEIYEELKSFAHIPLGIFSILSRFAGDSSKGQWIQPLADYRNLLQNALKNLHELQLPPANAADNKKILSDSIAYIDSIITKKAFTLAGFQNYAHQLGMEIMRNQTLAAKVQVKAFTKLLQEWKNLLGQESWSNLYVVSSALWTLSTANVHELIIANMMEPEKAASNIFVTSMPLSGVDAAQSLVGRVVTDRVMAQAVVPSDTKRGRENIHSLSSSRDLISKAAIDALKELNEEEAKAKVLN